MISFFPALSLCGFLIATGSASAATLAYQFSTSSPFNHPNGNTSFTTGLLDSSTNTTVIATITALNSHILTLDGNGIGVGITTDTTTDPSAQQNNMGAGEQFTISFSTDVILTSLRLSAFADAGEAMTWAVGSETGQFSSASTGGLADFSIPFPADLELAAGQVIAITADAGRFRVKGITVTTPIPEPSISFLAGIATLGFAGLRRR